MDILIKGIKEERFESVKDLITRNMTGKFLTQTVLISPILYTHPLISSELEAPIEGWYNWCLTLIVNQKTKKPRIDELMIYMIEGWKESVGIGIEMSVARSYGIKVSYCPCYDSPKEILK